MTTSATHLEGSNPFPTLWTQAVRDAGVTVVPYSSRTLLRGRCDVLHAHWPEKIWGRVGRSPGRAARVAARLVVLAIAKARGTRVVWTVHNMAPHDRASDPLGDLGVRAFERSVDELWVLSRASGRAAAARFGGRPTRLVRHPAFPTTSPLAPPPGRGAVLSFGEVRPYRGFLQLVREFVARRPEGLTLRLAGADRGDAYCAELAREVGAADGVVWVRERLDDAELEREILASDVVALHYERVTNSGAAMLALTLHRPVVVPRTEVFEELAEEVGPDWVHFFGDDLGADLRAAVVPPPGAPDLSLRSWEQLGATVANACAELAGSRRR